MALGMKQKPDVFSMPAPAPSKIGGSGGTIENPSMTGAKTVSMPMPGTKQPSAPADKITR